jgi:raffinose/stachyose/melibiose transport system substrate-binding protein
MKHRRHVLPLAVVATLALPPAGAMAQGSSRHLPAQGQHITLTELDWNPTGPDSTFFNEVNKAFEQQHPGVTVQRTAISFNADVSTIRLRAASPSAPCIIGANEGWSGVGALAKDNLLVPLNKYAQQYHWFTRYPTAVLAQQMVSANGKELGTGTLYEMATVLAGPQSIYYNKQLLSQLHLAVPSTLAQLEHDMAVAKAHGIVPMELGLQDQVQITVPLYQVLDAVTPAKQLSNFVYGIGKPTVASIGMTKAAGVIQTWAKDGYFPKDELGISSSQAQNNFFAGQGLFFPAWPGYSGTAAQDARTGVFALDGPNGRAEDQDNSNQPLGITRSCKYVSLAAQYLNYVSGPAAGRVAVHLGLVPQISVQGSSAGGDLLFRSELGLANRVAASNGYVPYFDLSTLTMLTTLERAGQSLVAGRMTPQAFTAALQSDYSAFHGS